MDLQKKLMQLFFLFGVIFLFINLSVIILPKLTGKIKITYDTCLKDPNSLGFSDDMIPFVILLINLFLTKSVFKH